MADVSADASGAYQEAEIEGRGMMQGCKEVREGCQRLPCVRVHSPQHEEAPHGCLLRGHDPTLQARSVGLRLIPTGQEASSMLRLRGAKFSSCYHAEDSSGDQTVLQTGAHKAVNALSGHIPLP